MNTKLTNFIKNTKLPTSSSSSSSSSSDWYSYEYFVDESDTLDVCLVYGVLHQIERHAIRPASSYPILLH